MPSGNFKTESSGLHLCGCWRLEVDSDEATQGGAEKKREKSQRALLANEEKCCKLTDLSIKWSAASASTSANTATTNVSNTVEPAHQGERQDREEE